MSGHLDLPASLADQQGSQADRPASSSQADRPANSYADRPNSQADRPASSLDLGDSTCDLLADAINEGFDTLDNENGDGGNSTERVDQPDNKQLETSFKEQPTVTADSVVAAAATVTETVKRRQAPAAAAKSSGKDEKAAVAAAASRTEKRRSLPVVGGMSDRHAATSTLDRHAAKQRRHAAAAASDRGAAAYHRQAASSRTLDRQPSPAACRHQSFSGAFQLPKYNSGSCGGNGGSYLPKFESNSRSKRLSLSLGESLKFIYYHVKSHRS